MRSIGAFEFNSKSIYVYAHYVGDDIIYIGCGKMIRPFIANGGGRLADWKKLTANGYRVEIYAGYETAKLAREAEKQLIQEFKPVCNRVFNGYVSLDSIGNTFHLGHRHTEEAKAKMAERQRESWEIKKHTRHRRPRSQIKCLDTEVVYSGLREAARQTGAHPSCISACINGRNMRAAGLRFVRLGG